MNNQFLTIKQAAKLIGVTELTLRNWDNSGKFTASRHPINNYRVYKKVEVDMLIEDMGSKLIKPRKPKLKSLKLNIKHLND